MNQGQNGGQPIPHNGALVRTRGCKLNEKDKKGRDRNSFYFNPDDAMALAHLLASAAQQGKCATVDIRTQKRLNQQSNREFDTAFILFREFVPQTQAQGQAAAPVQSAGPEGGYTAPAGGQGGPAFQLQSVSTPPPESTYNNTPANGVDPVRAALANAGSKINNG